MSVGLADFDRHHEAWAQDQGVGVQLFGVLAEFFRL